MSEDRYQDRKYSEKVFRFYSDENDKLSPPELEICILEELDPNYGMYVWPCSPVLAHYVWHNRRAVREKTVLELGAGTSLPGIVAAKCGAAVTLSDSDLLPRCLEITRKNLERNRITDVPVLGLTWGIFSPTLLQMKPNDIILASDCFYDPKDFEDIIVTLSYLLGKNPNSCCWTTYQERSSDWTIENLLEKWNLKCQSVPVSEFYPDDFTDARAHSTVHLWKITSR